MRIAPPIVLATSEGGTLSRVRSTDTDVELVLPSRTAKVLQLDECDLEDQDGSGHAKNQRSDRQASTIHGTITEAVSCEQQKAVGVRKQSHAVEQKVKGELAIRCVEGHGELEEELRYLNEQRNVAKL